MADIPEHDRDHHGDNHRDGGRRPDVGPDLLDDERALGARLRAARPLVDAGLLDPTAPVAVALIERAKALAAEPADAQPRVISLTHGGRTSSRARHRQQPARGRRVAVVAAAAMVLAGVGGLLVTGLDLDGGRPVVHGPVPAAADIEEVAAASEAATTASGRATLAFERIGGGLDESGQGEARFADDDVEVAFRYADPDGTPGSEILLRSVDGESYLLDGPPGDRRWVHDTGAGPGATGSPADLFRADPRTLLGTLRPEAGFEVVGTEAADDAGGQPGQHGQGIRHLRSTTPGDLAGLNLGLGPIDPRNVERIDLWVGDDDVVQRLDLVLVEEQELIELSGEEGTDLGPEVACQGGDGARVTVIDDLGNPSCRALDPSRVRIEQVTTRYSARFHDLGAPVTITAPADAVDVEAVG